MTRIRRRLLIDTSVIGIALTLLVAILGLTTRVLSPLDNWFYDRRAALCQHFTPPPTDKLAHVDIDDAALNSIGRWPWPRSQFAVLIDEIDLAGAKAIAPDVLFTEPTQRIAGQIDEDAVLAESIRRSGKVLLPVSLTIAGHPSPLLKKMLEYLQADFEMTVEQCQARLVADGLLAADARFPLDGFLQARSGAANALIARQLQRQPETTFAGLRTLLMPRTDPNITSSPALRILEEEYRRVRSVLPFRKFILPTPPSLGPVARYGGEQTPIPELGGVAAATGYVDYLQRDGGGVVRSMPLFAAYRDGLFPQIDIALACMTLGVDLRTVRVSPERIVIPKPAGYNADIVIPVRSRFSPTFGHPIGLVMDVPVRGKTDWETIYDHQRFQKPELHIPAAYIYEIHKLRQLVMRNNTSIDQAIAAILEQTDPDKIKPYLDRKIPADDFASRQQVAQGVLKDLRDSPQWMLVGMKDSELKPEEIKIRDVLAASERSLRRLVDENQRSDQLVIQRRADLRNRINGRAVFIGWTATGARDSVPTSIQPDCPGVVVHGMIFNAIMTGDFWRHAPRWVTLLITLAIGLIITAANGFLRPPTALLVAVAVGLVYLGINFYLLFDYGNWCVGVAGPMVALGSVWATGALASLLIEAAERARVMRHFASYNDPQLVDYVMENENAVLDGQMREMSVVFTDLQGFTTLSEQLRERTVSMLSEYLSCMVPIIRKRKGFVNKFLGDGIMCFFNAPFENPAHAQAAVETCLEMQVALNEFADGLVAQGLPRLAMRCGISSGEMVVGNSGPQDAADYTVLGDNVNLASRLEGANKVTGTCVLVSDRTRELCGDAILFRPVGRLQVVGKSQGVMTYEPLAPIERATPEQHQLAADCDRMVQAYVARDFARCIEWADALEQRFGPGKLTTLYRHTCQKYLADPPGPDFTGNLVLTEK